MTHSISSISVKKSSGIPNSKKSAVARVEALLNHIGQSERISVAAKINLLKEIKTLLNGSAAGERLSAGLSEALRNISGGYSVASFTADIDKIGPHAHKGVFGFFSAGASTRTTADRTSGTANKLIAEIDAELGRFSPTGSVESTVSNGNVSTDIDDTLTAEHIQKLQRAVDSYAREINRKITMVEAEADRLLAEQQLVTDVLSRPQPRSAKDDADIAAELEALTAETGHGATALTPTDSDAELEALADVSIGSRQEAVEGKPAERSPTSADPDIDLEVELGLKPDPKLSTGTAAAAPAVGSSSASGAQGQQAPQQIVAGQVPSRREIDKLPSLARSLWTTTGKTAEARAMRTPLNRARMSALMLRKCNVAFTDAVARGDLRTVSYLARTVKNVLLPLRVMTGMPKELTSRIATVRSQINRTSAELDVYLRLGRAGVPNVRAAFIDLQAAFVEVRAIETAYRTFAQSLSS